MKYSVIGYDKALKLLREGNYITIELGELPFICEDETHQLFIIRTDSFYHLLEDYKFKREMVDFTMYLTLVD